MISNPTLPQTEISKTETSAGDIATDLKGLSIDAFFRESFIQLLLREPETLTIWGLTKTLGLRNDQLNNISENYIRETQALESTILELRQKAMDELGDPFNLREFHNVVLGNGDLPLNVLERIVNDNIRTYP
jgi:uncharacterized protein (DUF885 family)